MKILILATVILSAIIAIFPAISCLSRKKTIENSVDAFIYSFLGGLLGGFIGSIIGCILGYLVSLIIPGTSGFIFSDLEKWIGFVLVLFACWLVGVIKGEIITIKPVIRFFSDN